MNILQKGFAHLFLIVVIVLAGLVGLLYYSWQKGLIKTIPSQEITPTPTLNLDKVPTWQTYSNHKYEFEIKYPSQWIYKEILPNTANNTYSWPPLNVLFTPEPIQPGIVWITIDTSQLTLDEYIDDQLCDAPGICASSKNATDTQLSGYSAKKVLDKPGPISTE